MNRYHDRCCRSFLWRRLVAERLVPRVLDELPLGPRTLEIGPGYGATTRVLTGLARRLTALEVDPKLASRLGEHLDGVDVVHGDGAAMPFVTGAFSSAVCFMMLHHVSSVRRQDLLFSEAHRVLAPGGVFAGCDSLTNLPFRLSHISDTMVTVDPGTLDERLRTAGFQDVTVGQGRGVLTFHAHKTA